MRSMPALLVLAGLVALSLPASAEADCIPCGPVDSLCRKYLGTSCLASEEAAPQSAAAAGPAPCAGEACDAINAVCRAAFGASCVGRMDLAEPGARCMGEVCDAGNAACYLVLRAHCLG